jgi:hypothetical protein
MSLLTEIREAAVAPRQAFDIHLAGVAMDTNTTPRRCDQHPDIGPVEVEWGLLASHRFVLLRADTPPSAIRPRTQILLNLALGGKNPEATRQI